MQDMRYYEMRAFLFERQTMNSVPFTLQELADLWECSTKNAKRKLKQYQALSLCVYEPGSGRGNMSKLTFSQDFQDEIDQFIRAAVEQENLDKLLILLQLNIPRDWFNAVSSQINELFGLQSKDNDQDVLRSIIARPFSVLDPLHTAINMESSLLTQLGDPLVQFDATNQTIKPCIAHYWTSENNHTTWTFYLRKGIRFHHGRTLTSQDVQHTLEKAMQKGTVAYWQLHDIQQIERPSNYKITIQLHKPNPFFIRYLCLGALVILPYDVPFDEYKWVSTGAFKIAERTPKKLVLEAFDNYFLERPLLDRIEFWLVENQRKPMAVITHLGNEESEDYTDYAAKDYGVNIITFHFEHCLFARHPAFREAMFHALNPKDMLQAMKDIENVEASSYFIQNSKPQQRDPSKIKALLKKANYNGEPLQFAVFSHVKTVQQGKWLVAHAAKFGIQLQLRIIDLSSQFYDKMLFDDIDMSMGGDVPSYDIEVAFMDFYSNPNLAPQRYLAKEDLAHIEILLQQARQFENQKERYAVYDQVESYARDNHLLLFMEHITKHQQIHSMIQTEEKHLYGHLNFKTLWIK
ncbi:ABC transporter substrate-binding protein [Listeria booriae]|uniref:ABC transporter substrate-binding protein n=1 Tax=Listeria booriae TaxID=1552123 RepID=UPI001627A9A5|nr:ABC transporter substrate-binding protein [Listeria booriae]MBC2194661.1 SgrR family transcriptional regulator [Listeria booriae]